ncbi:MAG: phospho-sugar mutase [Clostridia bacterium]|nr:phospho-sugar mutase [Clostridia bacterium]
MRRKLIPPLAASLLNRPVREDTDLKERMEYERWLAHAAGDVLNELRGMDDAAVEDAFYRDLAFGTGGLRGVIGAGTNRMNEYVVAKASQGLADYLNDTAEHPSVVIGYDSRIKSDVFAKVAAGVFAAGGVQVHIWPELLPVPTVSYAVRALGCSAGVMITASHNPSQYNGYKVYGPDGCQITTQAAADILARIDALDVFADVKRVSFEAGLASGRIEYIDGSVLTAFLEEVKGQSVLFGDAISRDVAIVYTPLNGTGLVPVTRALEESGFTNITVVEEQRKPDGRFPTCPYPNPEIREAMAMGLEYCEKTGADLLLATDPDCDRCGIAVKDGGGYRLLTGNEVGLLLLDFVCSQRQKHGKMPRRPVFVKTIVTMDLAEKIAARYGVETVNVLTGFKYIGEVIGRLEKEGRREDYICGFEESYGYLTGPYVRDKDGVNAAFMICEMFAYYKIRGVSLLEKLDELYREYGFCLNTLHAYEFSGSSGMVKMQSLMAAFRAGLDTIGGERVTRVEDYLPGLNGLPASDVLKFFTARASVVVRPSGTEPKLKLYVSVTAENRAEAEAAEQRIAADMERIIR